MRSFGKGQHKTTMIFNKVRNTFTKWFFAGSLLITSVAHAQQPSLTPYDADLTNYSYPYPVHFIALTIQGEVLQMAYMDVKPSNANGHVVMLLHGKNFNGAYWAQTAKRLAENGYRVIIIPDQIGFEKSSKPQAYSVFISAALSKY